ncbi:MAG: dihydroorotate dehydrogenase-like protein, partial [Anaerolineae bacterium]|nr:dihydroorotate dehydrogenase-like protein [Anaerolineae bacterium]
ADALELNIYDVPADPDLSGRDVEDRVIDLVGTVRAAVSIPLAVKTGPYFSSLLQMFQRLKGAGADALVLFNRFMQPDIDLDALSILPKVELSTSAELRLALRWIAIVRGRMSIDLAATSGVHRAEDALKLLLVGADVTMMTSALLKHGAGHVRQVEAGIRAWMEANEYASVDQLRGSLS